MEKIMSKTVGTILKEALESSSKSGESSEIVKVRMRYGDNFDNYWYEGEQIFDFCEYLAPPTNREQEGLLGALEFYPTDILDIGGGSGRVALWLQDKGYNVTVCETDPGCIELCNERGVKSLLPNSIADISLQFDLGFFLGGGFPANQFDYNLYRQTEAFLRSLFNVVKNGGHLLIDLLNDDSASEISDPQWKVATYEYNYGGQISESESYVYPHRDKVNEIMNSLGGKLKNQWITPFPPFQENLKGENYFVFMLWEKTNL
jgi:SAM-dependent methyltransferase